MKCGKNSLRGVSHIALATAITLAGTNLVPQFASDAEAKNLFEYFIDKQRERKARIAEQRRKRIEAQKALDNPPPPPPVAVTKVSAPKYYDYKADSFRKMDLSGLVKVLAAANAGSQELEQTALMNSGAGNTSAEYDASEVKLAATEDDAGTSRVDAVEQVGVGKTQADSKLQALFVAAASQSQNVEALDIMVEKGMGEAIAAHYSHRREFMWVDEHGQPNERAKALLEVFASAGSVGLYPDDYLVDVSKLKPAGDQVSDSDVKPDANKQVATAGTAEGAKVVSKPANAEGSQANPVAKPELVQKNQVAQAGTSPSETEYSVGKPFADKAAASLVAKSYGQGELDEAMAEELLVGPVDAVEEASVDQKAVYSIDEPEADSAELNVEHEMLVAAYGPEMPENAQALVEDGSAVGGVEEAASSDDAAAEISASKSMEAEKPADNEAAATDKSQTPDANVDWQAVLAFEMDMTARALRYMSDAQNGIIDPNKISGFHDFKGLAPDYKSLLSRLSNSEDVVALMNDMQPKGPAFQALKAELASLTNSDDDFKVEIPAKILIKPGQDSAELKNVIAAIRHFGSDELKETHSDVLASYSDSSNYDKPLVELVKSFQKEKGLGADGVIGPNTIAKLLGQTSPGKINRVKMAMERLRWQPDDLGSTHVFINQPAYTAKYMVGYKTKLGMRAIIGTKKNQTSFFNDEIETVVYNPYWGVPRSILVNEMLPKLRANPSYLDNAGYEVTNSRGQKVSSSSINWNAVGSKPPYDVRQKPGDENALGELKILFPNSHAIYMHDTPSRGLFERTNRALSHGCVRLHQPRDMAAAVLGKDVGYVSSKLAEGHGQESVPNKIPVYISYFTAWPNDDGKVEYFGDVYGRDDALSKAITATRKVRDQALKTADS